MNEIETSNPQLTADLKKLEELISDEATRDIANWPESDIQRRISPSVFRLIYTIAVESEKGTPFDDLVEEQSQTDYANLKTLTQERFGELMGSEKAKQILEAIPGVPPTDDLHKTPFSTAFSAYLLRRGSGLYPVIRYSLVGQDKDVLSRQSLEWDDCVIVSLNLIDVLARDIKLNNDLIRSGAIDIDWENMSDLVTECQSALGKLQAAVKLASKSK